MPIRLISLNISLPFTIKTFYSHLKHSEIHKHGLISPKKCRIMIQIPIKLNQMDFYYFDPHQTISSTLGQLSPPRKPKFIFFNYSPALFTHKPPRSLFAPQKYIIT